jgi:hypothetical protein
MIEGAQASISAPARYSIAPPRGQPTGTTAANDKETLHRDALHFI